MPPPGVYLKVPQRAPAAGPIPLHVAMVADMPTYYANNGILDNALEVVLVRRDAPGVRLLAKGEFGAKKLRFSVVGASAAAIAAVEKAGGTVELLKAKAEAEAAG